MTSTFTVTAADGEPPVDPKFLDELEDALRAQREAQLGLDLKDRPPLPGEQGGIPIALEVIASVTTLARPFARAFATALADNVRKHRPAKIKIDLGDGKSVELTASDAEDAAKVESVLTALLERKEAPEGD